MKYVLPIFIILGITPVAWAEETANNAATPPVLSLEEAQAIALKQHPEILSSDYRTKASKQAVKEARANYFPQANANAVRAFADDGTRLAAIGGINNPTVLDRGSYGVGVSQLITDFGRTNHQVDAAKAQVEAQAARSISARDQVLFDVTSAYYNVLRAQKIVQVAEATQKTRHSLLDQIGSLREAKMKSDLDVSIAKQSVSEANLLTLQAQNQLDDAEAQLSQTMGYNTQQHYILKDDAMAVPLSGELEPLLQQAKEQNPELQSLRAQLRAARKQTEAEKAANYPTVSAVGYAGENPIRDHTQLDSNYAAGGVNISIPIFTGGRLTATEKRSEYQAQAIEQDLFDKENQITRDVRLSWNNTQSAYKNISVSEELRKTSDEALELTQARYDIGKNSIVDLAQTQLAKTQAEIASANATYEYLIQRALLNYKTGNNLPSGVAIHKASYETN
jgi:outer membrane protein